MTVQKVAKALNARILAGEEHLDHPVEGGYVGDLLSWVMGRAKENDLWITVMGNVNAIAVAQLADISAILLCENAHLDDDAKSQAESNGIPVLACEEPAYDLAVKLAGLLK